jgi:hypothetical protein
MLTEMTGEERLDWMAYFDVKDEERRDRELDARGKAKIGSR